MMSAEQPDWADESEQRLLEAAIPLAASTGWNDRLLAGAARGAGLSEGEARLLLLQHLIASHQGRYEW